MTALTGGCRQNYDLSH